MSEQLSRSPDALEVGRVYGHRIDALDAELLRACAAVDGECPDGPGLGIAFVLALRTLIQTGILPDAAIMLGHRATWYAAPPTDEAVTTEMVIAEAEPGSGRYHRVVIAYRSQTDDGRRLIEQHQEVLWPTGG